MTIFRFSSSPSIPCSNPRLQFPPPSWVLRYSLRQCCMCAAQLTLSSLSAAGFLTGTRGCFADRWWSRLPKFSGKRTVNPKIHSLIYFSVNRFISNSFFLMNPFCYRSTLPPVGCARLQQQKRGLLVSLVFNHGRYYLLGPSGTNWLCCQNCHPWGFQFACYFLLLFL